jgi:hypothetical protein
MRGLNESDLVKIRQAFEKDSLSEALRTMENTLDELGYKKTDRIFPDDKYLYHLEMPQPRILVN